jgi:hypothetical protein
MPVETRYFRSDSQTVNGVSARILGLSLSGTGGSVSTRAVLPTSVTCYIGVRVYVVHADGSKVEITSGVSALVSFAASTTRTVKSATWSLANDVTLTGTDAVMVEVYIDNGIGWILVGTWITGQLGATKLNAATWTFYYTISSSYLYSKTTGNYTITSYFYFDGTDVSRIADFSWSVGPVYTLTLNVDKSSGYVGDAFTFTGTLTQNGTPIAGATVTLYKDNVALSPSTTTDAYGNYAFQWTADTAGNHSFYAEGVW